MVEITYIPPVQGYYRVRIFHGDFGGASLIDGRNALHPKIQQWLSDNVTVQDWEFIDMAGFGSGDHIEFRFVQEKHASLFLAFIKTEEW